MASGPDTIPSNVVARGESSASAGSQPQLKQCGIGCYLCYKEDSFGTLYQHWAENTPANAVLYMEPSENVAAFKFKQNGGRIEMSQNVNKGSQYYQVCARYIKEMMTPKYGANRITLLAHTQYVPLQLIFLKKGSGQVFYLKESGKSILFSPAEIAAVGLVNYNETSFLVQTMDYHLFVDKCAKLGSVATQ